MPLPARICAPQPQLARQRCLRQLAPKRGNQPLPPPGAGVQLDTARDPPVHVKRERAGHLAVPESPPVHRYGPPQPPLQPFPLVKLCLIACALTQFDLGIPTDVSFHLFLTGNLLI